MRCARFALPSLLSLALVACGSSKKEPPAGGGAGGRIDAGAGGAGGGASARGGAGAGGVEGGGDAGKAVNGGEAGVAANGAVGGGAIGGASSAGTSAAGAGMTPGAGGGGASGAGASDGGAGEGGAGDGAASNGGTSAAAGAGGVSGGVEPPPHCDSLRQFEQSDSCNYEYKCDGLTHYGSCSRDTDGTWACNCATFSTSRRYFEFEGVEGLEACAALAHVCESDLTVNPTRTCRAKEPIAGNGACSGRATCGYALDAGPDFRVRSIEEYRVQCEPANNTYFRDVGFDCSCRGGAFDGQRYRLTAPSIEDVCAPMVEFCFTEELPVFDGRVCRDAEPFGIVELSCPYDPDCQGCIMGRGCAETADLARDVAMIGDIERQDREVVCRGEQQGDVTCSCESDRGEVVGVDTVPAEILDICENSAAVCPPSVEP